MVFSELLAPDDQRVSPFLADEHDDDHLSLGVDTVRQTRIQVNHEGGRGRVPLGNLHDLRVSRRNPYRGEMGPRVVG